MGISTQVASQAAQNTINQPLTRSVAVANAVLKAQGTISTGTVDLAKSAVADNSTVTLTETKVTFQDNPATIHTGPVRTGQLNVSPPQEGNTPELNNLFTPTISGLPTSTEPNRLAPTGTVYVPSVEGDLVVPGGMARLEDVSLGAVTINAAPRAPTVLVPVLSTSPSENTTRPTLDDAAQHYVQVVVVGSAHSVVYTALPVSGPAGT